MGWLDRLDEKGCQADMPTLAPAKPSIPSFEGFEGRQAGKRAHVFSEKRGMRVGLGAEEEARIRHWLARIGEQDDDTIREVIEGCRRDRAVLSYFLKRANEDRRPDDTAARTLRAQPLGQQLSSGSLGNGEQ